MWTNYLVRGEKNPHKPKTDLILFTVAQWKLRRDMIVFYKYRRRGRDKYKGGRRAVSPKGNVGIRGINWPWRNLSWEVEKTFLSLAESSARTDVAQEYWGKNSNWLWDKPCLAYEKDSVLATVKNSILNDPVHCSPFLCS